MNDKTLIIIGVAAVSTLLLVLTGAVVAAMITPSTDTTTQKTPMITPTPTINPILIVNSSDGKTGYQALPDGSIRIIDNTKKNWQLWKIPITENTITNIKLTQNDSVLLVTDNTRKTSILNLTTHHVENTDPTPTPTYTITSTPMAPTLTPSVTPSLDPYTDRYVVIITPTPTPIESAKITDIQKPDVFIIGEPVSLSMSIQNNGVGPLENVDIRVQVYDYNKDGTTREMYSTMIPCSISIPEGRTGTIPPITKIVPSTFQYPNSNQSVPLKAAPYHVNVELRSNKTAKTLDTKSFNIKVQRWSSDGYGLTYD
jgi:hypothetical protein